jgi:lysophospholipase L1-like esterase
MILRATSWVYLPRRRSRQIAFVAAYLLFCGLLAASFSRLFWRIFAGVPLNQSATVWDFYFGELRSSGVVDATVLRDDESFDVLLLGGSVLEPDWGAVEARLGDVLREECGDDFRIFNLARAAHTSRDSYLKYAALSSKQFDLVIVYEGINDVRMNCCPRGAFRDDYTHCSWYRSFHDCLAAGSMTLREVVLDRRNEISRGEPLEEHIDLGDDIQSPRAMRKNLESILETARERGDTVVLQTYAYYIPEDYSRERMVSKSLDYQYYKDKPSCPVEMWGRPQNVKAAIDAQNDEIRKLAACHPELSLVEQHELIPKRGEFFVDPCHLSEAGVRRFVENLAPVVRDAVRRRKSSG